MAAPPTVRSTHVFRRALAIAAALLLIGAPTALAQLPTDSIGGGVGDSVGDVGSGVGDAVGDVGSGVGDAVGDVTDGADDSSGNENDGGIDDVVEDIGQGVGSTVGGVGGGVGKAIDEASGSAGNTIDGTTGAVGDSVDGTVGGINIPGGELIFGGGKGGGKKGDETPPVLPFEGSVAGADAILGLPMRPPSMSDIGERPNTDKREYSTTAAPPGDDQSVIERLAQAAAEAAKRFAFPLALAMVVGGFLMLQNRLDNRDRKLALAPVDAEQDLLSFK